MYERRRWCLSVISEIPSFRSASDDLVCLGNGHGSVNNDCVEELITNETEQTVTFPGEVSVAHERKRDCSSSHP